MKPAFSRKAWSSGIGKGDVQRGSVRRLAQGAQAQHQRLARARRRVGGDQQPPALDRRERHGDLQLGIIAPADALEGFGQAMIEDIFAHRMGLEIDRRAGGEPALRGLDQHMGGKPARALADAAGRLQRGEKAMGQKGIEALAGIRRRGGGGIGAGVPVRGRNGVDALDLPNAKGNGFHCAAIIARIGRAIQWREARVAPGLISALGRRAAAIRSASFGSLRPYDMKVPPAAVAD